jgi:nucleotide-binding universal stress UspA family protein
MQASKVKTAVVRAPVGGSDGVGITLKEWAAQEEPDALVVGSRGLGALSRWARAARCSSFSRAWCVAACMAAGRERTSGLI